MSNEVQQPTTDIATLPPADRAVIALNSSKTEEELRAIVAESKTVTEVKDKTDRELAHSLGMRLRKARTTIEKTGKAARDDATAFCKAVIDEEKRLKAITEAEETRIIGLRDAFDAKVEAEKKAAEALRAEIKSKIDGIRTLPQQLAFCTAAEINAERNALAEFTPSEDVFGDQYADCVQARTECLDALTDLYNRVMAQETAKAALDAERKKLAEERAELDRLRAEIEATRTAQFDKTRADMMNANPLASPVAAPDGAETEPSGQETDVITVVENVAVASPDLVIEVGTITADAETEPSVLEVTGAPTYWPPIAEQVAQEAETDPSPVSATEWKIRRAVLATADQFEALAEKTALCGVYSFAKELRDAADMLRNGDFDGAMAEADAGSMVAADVRMLDATAEFIEAMAPAEHQEAAEPAN